MPVSVGDIVEGKVTDIMNYGVFVKLERGKSGLVHISEVSKDYVEDIHTVLNQGDKVKVKVLSIDEKGKIALSIKKALPQVKENKGFTLCYNTYEKNGDIFHEEMPSEELIETFDIVYFRPDPPVDTDYINACFGFDFVDKKKTKIVNNTQQKGVNNIYLEKKE